MIKRIDCYEKIRRAPPFLEGHFGFFAWAIVYDLSAAYFAEGILNMWIGVNGCGAAGREHSILF